MDVTVEINKLPCDHVVITFTSGGKSVDRVYTLTGLKERLTFDSVDGAIDMIFPQIKKVIIENSGGTLLQLKQAVEAEVYKI